MSNEILVDHCSPTLAGIKVANLVAYKFTSIEKLNNEINCNNKLLNGKGIYFLLLKINKDRALIYVYRKKALQNLLANRVVQEFLKDYGYNDFSLSKALLILQNNLKNDSFPHEIGIFLGYPLEDTKAFIENKGANYKFSGFWKVYFNVEKAKQTFESYYICSNFFKEKLKKGLDIITLVPTT